MPELVLVAPGDNVPYSVSLDDSVTAKVLHFKSGATSQLSFELATPVSIPQDLLVQNGSRLLTLSEVRENLVATGAGLEARWHDLVDRLCRVELKAEVSASDALVVKGVEVSPAGATNVSASATLNLREHVMAGTELNARVQLLANCQVKLPTGLMSTRLELEFIIDSEVPRVTLAIPEMPLRMPAIALPDFDWTRIGQGALQWPELRLPALPFLPVSVTHGAIAFNGNMSATGQLEFTLSVDAVELAFAGAKAVWGKFEVVQQAGALEFKYVANLPVLTCSPFKIELPGPLRTLLMEVLSGKLNLLVKQDANAVLFGWLDVRFKLSSVADPSRHVTVDMTLPFYADKLVDSITDGQGNTVKRRVSLVDANVQLDTLVDWLPEGFSIRLGVPGVPGPNLLPVLKNIAALLAEMLAAGAQALSGLAQVAARALVVLAERLADALSGLDVTLVFDHRTGALQQLLFSVRRAAVDGRLDCERFGFNLSFPADVDVAVLFDLRSSHFDAYAIVSVDAGAPNEVASFGTDLWLGTKTTERPVGELGERPDKKRHMIDVYIDRKSTVTGRVSVVPIGIRSNRATFLHGLSPALPLAKGVPSTAFRGFELNSLADSFTSRFELNTDAVGKYLPFLNAPKDEPTAGGGVLDTLKQHIQIKSVSLPQLSGDIVKAQLGVDIYALGSTIATTFGLEVEPLTMTARLSGGSMVISVKPDKFDLFGMSGEFYDSGTGNKVVADQLVLDLSGSDPRLYVRPGLELRLEFKKLSSRGKPLVFKVESFAMHGAGLDLDAKMETDASIPLNGLGTDFKFKAARLSVRNSRVSSCALSATGKLPPALLGDVDAKLDLSFGMLKDRFGLLDGNLELINKGKPIRCESTHFEFTLDGVGVRVFEDAGELHFCAFVSGVAQFKPQVEELANGMFKRLAGVELSFTDCPVCGVSAVVERELRKLDLSFIVALDEPARANLFDLFKFEVRSIGLEPNCKLFDTPTPALVIGGQCEFADVGDVLRTECDFHKIYIAPPAEGFLPRIRCEGLGVGIRLGSAFEVEGKVVAVDRRIPTNVLESPRPQDSLEANGFMGQGRIAIQGLPPMAASFGFVEIYKEGWDKPRRAWFVFIEAQHLSYYFQLGPVPLYLREVGLGLGYHFTYVAIKEIDQAPSLPKILEKLDRIAEEAVEPAKLEAWAMDASDGLTLVARAMISMSSASSPTETLIWKPDDEKELPNLLLLNALMAMRNTTFVMSAQAWLGWNYHDWDANRKIGRNQLVGKQAMTGYVVLVGSRSEFLARLKSNRGGEVGPRLALPDAFKDALKETDYEATLYVRPGLLHMELGWPNRIRWTKNIAGANLTVAGGAIFRIHEESLLVGLNLEGQLTFSVSGSLDAGAVGISVSASVYTAIVARIIGYLDARRVSDSLYYSLFALQVRIEFAVSAWLEIDAWLCKITITASFSLSLQVDVLAELAVRGDGSLGTRVRATIAVSVFGYSLGLSIGLAANSGIVDVASARVARFMQLGLEQPIPDVSPPLPKQNEALDAAQRVGAQRRNAQANAASANVANHPENLAPVPHEEALPKEFTPPPSPGGRDIGATDFRLVATYPMAAPEGHAEFNLSEWVYLTFMPMEATSDAKASFYAVPPWPNTAGVDHEVDFTKLGVTGNDDVYQWKDGVWSAISAAGLGKVETHVSWKETLAYEESTRERGAGGSQADNQVATLADLFFAAFRTAAKNSSEVGTYKEPKKRPPAEFERAQARSTDLAEAHMQQQAHYASAIQQDPADRRCYEARDFLLHKFISDLFEYASAGKRPTQVHVLHLGLTFMVRRSVLDKVQAEAPIALLKKRVTKENVGQPPIHSLEPSAPSVVFNPPSKTFGRHSPTFGSLFSDVIDGKVKLDWELDWELDGKYVDVEHYLQYYEVRRWIELPDGKTIDSDAILVKRADGDDTTPEKRRILRGEWQFTDDFQDLSAAQLKELREGGAKALIRYSVTPVCVSNTRGRTCSSFVLPFGGWPVLQAPRGAKASFRINPKGKTVQERLTFKIEMEVEAKFPPIGSPMWRLLWRPQDIIPAGQYGSDAESQRSLGDWLSSSAERQENDVVLFLDLNGVDHDMRLTSLTFDNTAPEAEAIHKMLADTSDPRAWRILVQQVVCKTGSQDVLAASACTEVELKVELLAADGKGISLVGLRPGAFEYIRLPEGAEKAAMAPVAVEAFQPVVSGRTVLVEPDKKPCVCAAHPDFGAATRLGWNVTPHGLDAAALAPYRMLAGFDILRLDLDGASASFNFASKDNWKRARVVASTRLLAPEKVVLLPGEIGEVANWKAAYPSSAARSRAGGAWYSAAESYIDWPPPCSELELLKEPSRELLGGLLHTGVPKVLRLTMVRDADKNAQEIKWAFALRQAAPGGTPDQQAIDNAWRLVDGALHFEGNVDAAASLRSALRRLEAHASVAEKFVGFSRSQLRGWHLQMECMFEPQPNVAPVKLHGEQVALNFDRSLHPLLESLIARMRRSTDERLFDADRRPPPQLKAKDFTEFAVATSGAQDPYGWLMLDRLGLGVTLRLFDSLNDCFLPFAKLHEQFKRALQEIQAEKLYADQLKFITVEFLRRPGGLVEVVPFDRMADANGFYGQPGADWHDGDALSMLRISVRPRIEKLYSYRVKQFASDATEADLMGIGKVEAMLASDSAPTRIDKPADLVTMLRGAAIRDGAAERIVFMRSSDSFGAVDGEDTLPGANGELPDAFGRFPPISWEGKTSPIDWQMDRFWLLLGNVLELDQKSEKPDRESLKLNWQKYNQRFFEHSSGSPLDGDVTYAFAATDAKDPVMVAQDGYGRASVLLPEPDGYSHAFAYAVVPQWRYAAVLEAAGYKSQADAAGESMPYVMATVQRTAPVTPPALLSLGRLGDVVWWRSPAGLIAKSLDATVVPGEVRLGIDAGLSSMLLMPHHLERRIARANTPAQRSLSHTGELYTQIGAVEDPKWCKAYLGNLPLLPEAGISVAPVDEAAIEALDQLPKPLLPIDRSRLRLVSYLPHWYRSFAVIAAAAGAEVSSPVVSSLPSPAARLVLFDRTAHTRKLIKNHSWTGETEVDAHGTQTTQVDTVSGPAKYAAFGRQMKLLRYRDTTDEVTEELWRDEVSLLPDPGVSYQLDLVTPARPQLGEPRAVVDPVARLVRGPADVNDPYRVMPISGDWHVTAEAQDGGLTLRIMLAPLGRVMFDPGLPRIAFPNVNRAANGAMRVPGGWTLEWLGVLLANLPTGSAQDRLNWAALLWRQVDLDGIGVADDGSGFFNQLPAVQLWRMEITRPANNTQWDALIDAIEAWAVDHAHEKVQTLLAELVFDWFEPLLHKNWPTAGNTLTVDVPWLPFEMHGPNSPLVAMQVVGRCRFLLPDLMSPADVERLGAPDQDASSRANRLWADQKKRAIGVGRRLHIEAQRGDVVPLQLLPLELA